MEFKDYYKILGVERTSDAKEIKKSFRRLARRYHPDLNPGNKEFEARFKEINEAYEVLGDPSKRKRYDELGSAWDTHGQRDTEEFWRDFYTRYGGQGSAEQATSQEAFEGVGFSDFFKTFFGGQWGSGRARTARTTRFTAENREPYYIRQTPEPETVTDVEVSFDESYRGSTRKIRVDYEEVCRSCGGTGLSPRNEQCATCRGKRLERKSKQVNITIPPGVKQEAKLRVPGVLGGKNLYLVVKVKNHAFFRREGDNVILDLPVTINEAVLGTELEVPTLNGKVKMIIPPETQNFTSFRLPGFGFPRMKNEGKGDQIVRISVVIPKGLNQKEKKLYEELATLRSDNPRYHLVVPG